MHGRGVTCYVWSCAATTPSLQADVQRRNAMKRLVVLLIALASAGWAAAEAKLGKVHFKVECTEAAQADFTVAMAYYHSFAWKQMQAPLERVLKADPSCGMAHWARALALLNN